MAPVLMLLSFRSHRVIDSLIVANDTSSTEAWCQHSAGTVGEFHNVWRLVTVQIYFCIILCPLPSHLPLSSDAWLLELNSVPYELELADHETEKWLRNAAVPYVVLSITFDALRVRLCSFFADCTESYAFTKSTIGVGFTMLAAAAFSLVYISVSIGDFCHAINFCCTVIGTGTEM